MCMERDSGKRPWRHREEGDLVLDGTTLQWSRSNDKSCSCVWFPSKMMSEEWSQQFHSHDTSLPRLSHASD